MDEPLSNLDAKLRGYMRAELKHMQHDLGVTTVYVTHDQVEAMTLAHRVAVMDHGVLQQIGTPREVYDQPANLFVAGFMGSPPMNLVHGRIEHERFARDGISLPLEGATAPCGAVLGFRPEDAEIVDPGGGLFDATVFAAELTGDVTLVTITLGEDSLAVKMPKEYEVDFDSQVAVRFPPECGFLFDAASGERIDARLADTSGP
jgi:multiple sugar transport system ATP-binding protein